MIKVLVTGTVDVGKTQLLNHYRKLQLSRLVILQNTAKLLIKNALYDRKHAVFQDYTFAEQIHQEIEAEKAQPRIILCHRGALDCIAHAQLYGHQVRREWLEWTNQAYDKIVVLTKKKYPSGSSQELLSKTIAQILLKTDLPVEQLQTDDFFKQLETERSRQLLQSILR